MAIVAADIKKRFSVKTGAAGDSTASSAAASLGKYVSTTDITLATLNNLFRAITSDEAAVGITIYRCFFLLNDHATYTFTDVLVWIASQIAGGGTVSMGLDPAGAAPRGQAGAQAAEIANEETAPTGVTFSSPTTEGTALSIGDLAVDGCYAIWLKLVVPAGASALALDQAVLTVKGQTLP